MKKKAIRALASTLLKNLAFSTSKSYFIKFNPQLYNLLYITSLILYPKKILFIYFYIHSTLSLSPHNGRPTTTTLHHHKPTIRHHCKTHQKSTTTTIKPTKKSPPLPHHQNHNLPSPNHHHKPSQNLNQIYK